MVPHPTAPIIIYPSVSVVSDDHTAFGEVETKTPALHSPPPLCLLRAARRLWKRDRSESALSAGSQLCIISTECRVQKGVLAPHSPIHCSAELSLIHPNPHNA